MNEVKPNLPQRLRVGRLDFIEHNDSIASRDSARRDGKRQPPTKWAWYGGEKLTEKQLRERIPNTTALRSLAQ